MRNYNPYYHQYNYYFPLIINKVMEQLISIQLEVMVLYLKLYIFIILHHFHISLYLYISSFHLILYLNLIYFGLYLIRLFFGLKIIIIVIKNQFYFDLIFLFNYKLFMDIFSIVKLLDYYIYLFFTL
jgi:hypothetical protein